MKNKCKVLGCDGIYRGKGYCRRHYYQIKRYGHILSRTTSEPNEIIKHVNYAELVLYDKQNKETARTKIDLEDIDKVKCIKWYKENNGYVRSGKKINFQRFLIDCPKDKVVDHINRNKLDNRKTNLRICTTQQNIMNRRFKGYSYIKNKNKWKVSLGFNYKNISLGSFDTEEEAIDVRKKAEKKYFGEYAYTDLSRCDYINELADSWFKED